MKHQKVSVDVWAMIQGMLGYLALAALGGLLLRLLVAVVTLPGRLSRQRDEVQRAMHKLQEKYPEAFQEAMEEDQEKGEGAEGAEVTEGTEDTEDTEGGRETEVPNDEDEKPEELKKTD